MNIKKMTSQMDIIRYLFNMFRSNHKLTRVQLNYLLNNINPLLLKSQIPYFKWLCKYIDDETLEVCLKTNPELIEIFI